MVVEIGESKPKPRNAGVWGDIDGIKIGGHWYQPQGRSFHGQGFGTAVQHSAELNANNNGTVQVIHVHPKGEACVDEQCRVVMPPR